MNSPSFKSAGQAGASVFELEHFLPYRLSLLTNTVSDGIARSYRDKYHISVTEWRILAVLGRYPGLTASQIVDRTAMDKVAICRAVKTLVERNLLERITDQQDRRRMLLFITPKHGRKMLNEGMPLARQYESDLLEALSSKEQETLQKTIQLLLTRAKFLNLK
jgi:DNA-binding MarR family transcriptional regulator